jgi:small subunit ribosomal protein S20
VANHPSAIKRHRQSLIRRTSNRNVKSKLSTLVRRVNEAITEGNGDEAKQGLLAASKALASAGSKGVIHPRAASRRTGRLARKVARLSAQ